jgi:hypothetical protein
MFTIVPNVDANLLVCQGVFSYSVVFNVYANQAKKAIAAESSENLVVSQKDLRNAQSIFNRQRASSTSCKLQ